MKRILSCLTGIGMWGVGMVAAQTIEIMAPAEREVYQRVEFKRTIEVPVRVRAGGLGSADRVQARVVVDGREGSWMPLQRQGEDVEGVMSGSLDLPHGGWHRVQVRVQRSGRDQVLEEISEVGVGEVLLCLGGGLAANTVGVEGAGALPMVSMWDGRGWVEASDPLAGADGEGASVWSGLAEGLAVRLGVPVGIVCVAARGSTIGDWQVEGELYRRVRGYLLGPGQLYGARTVLWLHGEQDSLEGTSINDYQQGLRALVEASQKDFGRELAWGVALASQHPGAARNHNQQVMQAIRQTVRQQASVFAGPDTSGYPDLEGMRGEGVYFGPVGAARLRADWMAELVRYFNW